MCTSEKTREEIFSRRNTELKEEAEEEENQAATEEISSLSEKMTT